MFGRQLADPGRDQVHALGDHFRRAHLAIGVLERDREMRRVGDDHVGGRHARHHAAPRERALLRADPALHVRIAFVLAMLALHFSLVMRNFLLYCQSWYGTSSAATTSMPATVIPQHTAIRCSASMSRH